MGLKYKGDDVELRKAHYDNGRVALVMITPEGERYCNITTNAYDLPLGEGESHIKVWGGQEGMLEWLLENNLATDTGRRDRCGYAEAPVVRLNLESVKDY